MPATVCTSLIPLPKGWPRRVRSAAIHTISLAQTSLTHARSVAANNVNARIRLKEEINRLRQEVLLLREESRIKDARMEQIPAQRRPHYPPVERLAILQLRAARRWSLTQTAKRFLVTPVTVASWIWDCGQPRQRRGTSSILAKTGGRFLAEILDEHSGAAFTRPCLRVLAEFRS